MLEPSNINRYAKKDPEKILFENLYNKFGKRFLNYRKRYERNIKKLDLNENTDYPNTVILELINRCDLECAMCFQGYRNDAKKHTLDDKILDKIFQDFKENNLNSLMFSASEPLLYKRIEKVFDRAKRANIMDIFLFTNGTLLNEKNINLILKSPITRLFVSIDAATQETYDKIRVPVSKKKLADNKRLLKLEINIKRFIELREKNKKQLPLVRTSFVAMNDNKSEISEFISKWESIVDTVEIQKKVIPFRTFEEAKENSYKNENKGRQYSCNEPWGQITIYSDGAVSPCCATFGRNLPIGNIKKNSLKEIWNGNKMKEIRNNFHNNTPHSVCKTCIDNTQDYIS